MPSGQYPGSKPIWDPFGQKPGHLGMGEPLCIPYWSHMGFPTWVFTRANPHGYHMGKIWANPYRRVFGLAHVGVAWEKSGQAHMGIYMGWPKWVSYGKYLGQSLVGFTWACPHGYRMGKIWVIPYGNVHGLAHIGVIWEKPGQAHLGFAWACLHG